MQPANTNSVLEPPRSNGHNALDDIFVLSDEQILEIDPEPAGAGRPQDVEVKATEAEGKSAVRSDVRRAETTAEASTSTGPAPSAIKTETATPDTAAPATPANTNAAPTPFSSPDDIRAVAELYPGGIAQAKSAAERARTLDEIDAAYFGATGYSPEQVSAARAQLAERMLRENPTAFREMVFAGLRALEAASVAQPLLAVPTANAATTQDVPVVNATAPLATTALNARDAQARVPAPPQHLAVYAEFEKAANADLEKSVGGAIERALHQALPNIAQRDADATVGARGVVPLQERLSAAIRQDVEKALQGDRQLGEQIAQIVSARRFDAETRAQVVRLINDRAQQLVPVAAKRALNDWTQATLAAHHSKTARADAASSRRELAAAAPIPRDLHANARREALRSPENAGQSRPASKGRVDYRKLSDDQILDL